MVGGVGISCHHQEYGTGQANNAEVAAPSKLEEIALTYHSGDHELEGVQGVSTAREVSYTGITVPSLFPDDVPSGTKYETHLESQCALRRRLFWVATIVVLLCGLEAVLRVFLLEVVPAIGWLVGTCAWLPLTVCLSGGDFKHRVRLPSYHEAPQKYRKQRLRASALLGVTALGTAAIFSISAFDTLRFGHIMMDGAQCTTRSSLTRGLKSNMTCYNFEMLMFLLLLLSTLLILLLVLQVALAHKLLRVTTILEENVEAMNVRVSPHLRLHALEASHCRPHNRRKSSASFFQLHDSTSGDLPQRRCSESFPLPPDERLAKDGGGQCPHGCVNARNILIFERLLKHFLTYLEHLLHLLRVHPAALSTKHSSALPADDVSPQRLTRSCVMSFPSSPRTPGSLRPLTFTGPPAP